MARNEVTRAAKEITFGTRPIRRFAVRFYSMILFAVLVCPVLAAEDPPKPQNELISDFVDNPGRYKGKTLTLQVQYDGGAGKTLRERLGGKSVPFKGKDPNNGAKLVLGLDLPKDLDVPNAQQGEEVIVTFKCEAGNTSKGNTVTMITRPKGKK